MNGGSIAMEQFENTGRKNREFVSGGFYLALGASVLLVLIIAAITLTVAGFSVRASAGDSNRRRHFISESQDRNFLSPRPTIVPVKTLPAAETAAETVAASATEVAVEIKTAVEPGTDSETGFVSARPLLRNEPAAAAAAPAETDNGEKSEMVFPAWMFPPEGLGKDEIYIRIVKSEYFMLVFRGSELIETFPIAIGSNSDGLDKQAVGDHRTPEGVFPIVSVEPASHWLFEGRYAYGPWFFRLKTPPWKGIGIHGTDEPESMGTKASQGCIRMLDEQLLELKQLAGPGTLVEIIP